MRSIIKNILKYFVLEIYKIRFRLKHVVFRKRTRVNLKTNFEGFNLVGANSSVEGSYIGYGSYIGDHSKLENIKIGKYCSVGSEVQVITGNHPTRVWVSTHPSFYSTKQQAGFTYVDKELLNLSKNIGDSDYVCEIKDDVWVGERVSILQGITIAEGCVLEACSVVTKDTEPYGLYVGVPARKIGTRFNEEQIEFLIKYKWWNKDAKFLKENRELSENTGIFFQTLRGMQ